MGALAIAIAVSLLGFAAACGEGPARPVDGATDAPVDVGAEGPSPAAPIAWPCPDGWSAADGACAPWPVDGPGCGPDEVRFPGDDACAPIGVCPAGDFADVAAASGRVLHVRSGIAPGGDGSRAAPLSTIADAMSRAAAGDVISLAKGSYDAVVRLRAGVRLVGACAAETGITTDRPNDFEGVVTVEGADAGLEGVTLSGARAGLWVDARSVSVKDVVIDGATGFGAVIAFGGRVDGEGLVIRRTLRRDGRFGVGLIAADGGVAVLDRVFIADNLEVGASATDEGTSLSLRRAVLSGTGTDAAGRFGRGLVAQGGAAVTLSECAVQYNAESAIVVSDPGSSVVADGLVVYGPASDTEARGVAALRGGTATLRRVFVGRAREYAVAAAQDGATLVLEDALVRRMRAAQDGTSGHGVLVDEGASASLARVRLEETRDTALLARGVGTTVNATDLVIVRTESAVWDDSRGVGVEANDGASFVASRVELAENRQAGVVAFDDGTRIRLEDARITDTRERACAADGCAGFGAGVGAVAVRGAEVSLSRFVIERSALAGAQMVAATLMLSDGEIRENPIAVNLQDTERSLEDVAVDVRFVDNERTFDAAILWVPDAR